MNPFFLFICTVVFILISNVITSPASAAEQKDIGAEAVTAAQVFLHLADDGNYGASWEKTAPIFKRRVSREQWRANLSEVRPPFGAVILRRVEAATFSPALPGVPDGEYVTIRFVSSFEKKAEAIETVTLVRLQEEWHVAGYFIK